MHTISGYRESRDQRGDPAITRALLPKEQAQSCVILFTEQGRTLVSYPIRQFRRDGMGLTMDRDFNVAIRSEKLTDAELQNHELESATGGLAGSSGSWGEPEDRFAPRWSVPSTSRYSGWKHRG